MASIARRKGPQGIAYLVSIRRRGHPPIYETFASLADAKAFAARTEANIADRKHYGMARVRTIADLIDAYGPEAKPIKTAATRKRALAWWREHFGNVKLRDFDAAMIVKAKRKLSADGVKRQALHKPRRWRLRLATRLTTCCGGAARQAVSNGCHVQ